MPFLQSFNISHQFGNGELLFQSISCSMNQSRVGLVGRNGVGKSILGSMLFGEIIPISGTVTPPSSFAIYRQQPSELLSGELSIAEFLGKHTVLAALKRIEAGDCADEWFEIVGEQWDLEVRLMQQLHAMSLPQEPNFPCSQLSGGQLARLQLWQLFESEVDVLMLDEPSNHLDAVSKQWLIERIQLFDGAILLISHDRELLRECGEIWELSSLGIQVFGGNYDFYAEQKEVENQAVTRQLSSISRQQKQLEEQAQRNREKADQQASKGNRLRKQGSQPKILMDAKKDSATAQASRRNKNEQLRKVHLRQKEQALRLRLEQIKSQKIYLNSDHKGSSTVISMLNAVLPFGNNTPITLQVSANDKVHLTGTNGCGKSTLLKTLLGHFTLAKGEVQLNTPLHYLDQHFGSICHELTLLENLVGRCEGMEESDARTLLAGIGFRRDSVFRLGEALSGGEKMKLAMLIVSHQPTQPLLLLDEPDNHLDIESKIMLANALESYQGGYILISHDQDFAVESGVSRQIEIA
ncbi:ATP-binding cassette domain-containing protein [Vibrio kasasachensis]|uniref:ABC-F family ATP-binding cassette domain-containing protein n=1 Tax=Vibrio kasasachensis TaxID=2910248 RepID=UPI003D09D1AB